MLSREASAEPGQWKTDRAPYQRGIMDALCDAYTEWVVLMCASQVGKTEIILNSVGFYIEHDPSPTLCVLPTLDMAQAWSKDRLAPMLRDTPSLQGKVKDPKAKDSENTQLHKKFPGGHITLCGANSPASLSSRPCRIILYDEVDRFPASAGSEGDPVKLAAKRAVTFWNRKKLAVSSPTIKGFSRIEALYNGSDKRQYFVPCPHCGEFQTLKWSNVIFDRERPELAVLHCEICGAEITDADKPEMLAQGFWEAGAEFNGTAGFHLNELYSPWVTFGQMAAEFMEAKKLPETLQTFVNTALAETWEEKGERLEDETIAARRENYGPEIPEGAVLLTAGVDTQDNRIEVEVVAWGKDFESWGMEHEIIPGDPETPELWAALDEYLLKKWILPNGREIPIDGACVDSGGHSTDQVYEFCRARFRRNIWAIKGQSSPGKPIANPLDKKRSARRKPVMLNVDAGKDALYKRLRIQEPGPGYCHFSTRYDDEYFKQLTAEEIKTKYTKGNPVRYWHLPSGRRNEALDLRVYAMAAYALLNPSMDRLLVKRGAVPVQAPAEGAGEVEEPTETNTQKPKKKSTRRGSARRRGGYINSWR